MRVVVLDDHLAFGEALCLAISGAPGIDCVGHAPSIPECVDLAVETMPDVVILDYQLLEGNGLDAAIALREAGVESELVMLTANASPDLHDRALAFGIEGGVLPKHAPLAEVLAVVRSLAPASA